MRLVGVATLSGNINVVESGRDIDDFYMLFIMNDNGAIEKSMRKSCNDKLDNITADGKLMETLISVSCEHEIDVNYSKYRVKLKRNVNYYKLQDKELVEITEEIYNESAEVTSILTDVASKIIQEQHVKLAEQQRIDIEKENIFSLVDITNSVDNTRIIENVHKDNGQKDCSICCGKGRYQSETLGIWITCDCVYKSKDTLRDTAIKEVKMFAKRAEVEAAVTEGLIPYNRRNDKYSIDIMTKRVAAQLKQEHSTVGKNDYTIYLETLSNILAGVATENKIRYSYLISAPNGFSKTTFANTCIATLNSKARKVVPYKSLEELARLKMEFNSRWFSVMNKTVTKKNMDEDVRKTFKWKDYEEADILFCFLTTPDIGNMELSTLKSLLMVRSNNGLPTVTFMDRSLNVYKNNQKIERYLLDDMVAYREDMATLDRMLYICLSKQKNTSVKLDDQ